MAINGSQRPLDGVAATSQTDVWAVGGTGLDPVALHDTGAGFVPATTATTGFPANQFNAVSATSPSDVWIVGAGRKTRNYGESHALIEHYNGSAWSVAAAPDPGAGSRLSGVVALAPNNVWAVGGVGFQSPVIEHFDGHAWSLVAPPAGAAGPLTSVAAAGPSDIKAAGTVGFDTADMILSYNGTKWTTTTIPRPANADSVALYGITNVPHTGNYQAVGGIDLVGSGGWVTPAAHILTFNGSTWRTATTPAAAGGTATLQSVDAVGATESTSVGTVTEHFNGATWSAGAQTSANLSAVTHVGQTEYAVGYDSTGRPVAVTSGC